MGIIIGDNFNYQGKKFLDYRQQFQTLKAMREYPESSIPNGIITFCNQNKKHYYYDENFSYDEETGKWRVFSGEAVDNNGNLIWIGDTEPENEESVVWIDTSQKDEVITDALDDLVLNEFKTIIKNLTDEIAAVKKKNLELELRIIYLEENGTSKPEEPNISDKALTFEDGKILTFEDGKIMIFE